MHVGKGSMPEEVCNLECLVSSRGSFCHGLGSNIMVQYSLRPIITLHGRARENVNRLGNNAYPTIQTSFPNNDAVFQDDSVAFKQL
jgi:hypothetical protein